MNKIKSNKIPVSITNVTLTRLNDGLTKSSTGLKFIEWDEKGSFKKLHDEMQVGRSAILAPFSDFYTWMTTPIVKIVSDTEFKTENSHYEIEYK